VISSKSRVKITKKAIPLKIWRGIRFFCYGFPRKLKRNDVAAVTHGVPVFALCYSFLLALSSSKV
jgi:hypothetical protein